MKRIILCNLIGFAVFGLLSVLKAEAIMIGLTTADIKVHATPNGDVVHSLKAQAVVGILKVAGDWTQVIYFPTADTRNTKTGWINSKYVRIVSGGAPGTGDCESEYKTGAEVCVRVTDASLDCRRAFTGNSYRGCDVILSYELSTDYSGGDYLDLDVECEVQIKYTGREMYTWRSDSSSQEESHNLFADASDSESMSFDFSFGFLNEVNQVKIDSASCAINSVNLW